MTGRRKLTTTIALTLGALVVAAGAGADHGRGDRTRDSGRAAGWTEVTRVGAAFFGDGWAAGVRVRSHGHDDHGRDDHHRHDARPRHDQRYRLPARVYRTERYHYHYDDHGRGQRGLHVPPGHLPPPGLCKVWYPDVPPGHQPPPTDCWAAERTAWRTGGTVIYGDPACRH